MSESPSSQKSKLRLEIRSALQELSRDDREAAAVALCARLIEQSIWQNARSVLLFSPLPDEPNIRPLLHAALKAGKLTALPRYSADLACYEAAVVHDTSRDFIEGKFGILEPSTHCPGLPVNRLDLVLVPGVAFDWHGRRLGRGKGFYDRLLAEVSGTTCGVAFEQQMVEAIPVEPHDVRLNCILTPSRWLEV